MVSFFHDYFSYLIGKVCVDVVQLAPELLYRPVVGFALGD
jgi:hypothetical protein